MHLLRVSPTQSGIRTGCRISFEFLPVCPLNFYLFRPSLAGGICVSLITIIVLIFQIVVNCTFLVSWCPTSNAPVNKPLRLAFLSGSLGFLDG